MTDSPDAGSPTGPHDKLTTDPPLPPGTPDVDELVGEAAPHSGADHVTPDDAAPDRDPEDTVSVEPPD